MGNLKLHRGISAVFGFLLTLTSLWMSIASAGSLIGHYQGALGTPGLGASMYISENSSGNGKYNSSISVRNKWKNIPGYCCENVFWYFGFSDEELAGGALDFETVNLMAMVGPGTGQNTPTYKMKGKGIVGGAMTFTLEKYESYYFDKLEWSDTVTVTMPIAYGVHAMAYPKSSKATGYGHVEWDSAGMWSITQGKQAHSRIYNEGTVAVLTAVPDPGDYFDYWENRDTGEIVSYQNPLTVLVDEEKDFYAHFSDTAPAKPNNFLTSACTPCAEAEGDPVQSATGEFYTAPITDISLGGRLSLTFSRAYAARLKTEGTIQSSLGDNWAHNYDLKLNKISDAALDIVYLKGKIIRFIKSGTDWVLENPEETVYQLQEDPASNYFALMDPKSNMLYHFNAADGMLLHIVDRNLNWLQLTYDNNKQLSTVTDGLGRALGFSYAGNNLVGVSDGTRTVTYAYTANVLTSVIDVNGHTTTYAYDQSNTQVGPLLTTITQPLGNSHQTQTYDGLGRVTQQVDNDYNSLTFQYDTPSTGITTITDPLGNSRQTIHEGQRTMIGKEDYKGKSVTRQYDANNRPTTTIDREGNQIKLSYHAPSGQLSSATDSQGDMMNQTFTPQMQSFGPYTFTFYNLTRLDHPDGTFETFEFDDFGNLKKRTNQAGLVWTYTYNQRGQELSETNPEGGVYAYTYNSNGTILSIKDADTQAMTFEYDALGRLTKTIRPDGMAITRAYDAKGHVIQQTDENGNTIGFGFDANDNVTAIKGALGNVTTYTYDNMDRAVQSIDHRGATTKLSYNNSGLPDKITDANGNIFQTEYDENGRPVKTIDGAGKVRTTAYDAEGQVISTTSPGGLTLEYTYDSLGRVVKVQGPLDIKEQMTYDKNSLLTSLSDPLGRITTYKYDPLGLVSGFALPGTGSASFLRNNQGALTGITDLRGMNWTFQTTAMKKVVSMQDPLGNQTSYDYDASGRLTKITHPTQEEQTYTYDNLGNVLLVSHSDGTNIAATFDTLNQMISTDGISFEYDPEGNIVKTTDSGTAFGAAYDLGGRLTQVTYDNNTFWITYTYDVRNLLTQVTDTLTGVTIGFTYNDDGQMTGMTRSNGIDTSVTMDGAGRVNNITHGQISSQEITYNAAGEITQLTSDVPLSPAGFINSLSNTFQYDDAGNLSSAGYTSDARGRLLTSPGHTFVWDGADRLTGTGPAVFTYNGVGNLRSRTEGNTTTHYYYNHGVNLNPIMAEKQEKNNETLRYYVWTPGGQLLYMIDTLDNNKAYFYHFDHMGSTLFLTDNTGTVTDSYAYSPYGSILSHTGTSLQPFTFVGQFGVRQEGDAGLYHMRARYYDAVTARFLNPDATWPNIASWSGLNPYLYGNANPMKYIDVNGNNPIVKGVVKYIAKKVGSEAAKYISKRMTATVAKGASDSLLGDARQQIANQSRLSASERQKHRVYDSAAQSLTRFEATVGARYKDASWEETAIGFLNPIEYLESIGKAGRTSLDVENIMKVGSILDLYNNADKYGAKQTLKAIERLVTVQDMAFGESWAGAVAKAVLDALYTKWLEEMGGNLDLFFCNIEALGINSAEDLAYFFKTKRFRHIDFLEQNRNSSSHAGKIQSMITQMTRLKDRGGSLAAVVQMYSNRINRNSRSPQARFD